jgi:hypothetical protein
MLVNAATGEDMCTSVEISEYGKLKCNTTAGDFEAGVELAIKDTETGVIYNCAATNTA